MHTKVVRFELYPASNRPVGHLIRILLWVEGNVATNGEPIPQTWASITSFTLHTVQPNYSEFALSSGIVVACGFVTPQAVDILGNIMPLLTLHFYKDQRRIEFCFKFNIRSSIF